MTIKRRDFLKGLLLFYPVAQCLKALAQVKRRGIASSANDPFYNSRLPVLQGATSITATQINVLSNQDIKISLMSQTGEKTLATFKQQVISKSFSTWKAYRLAIEGLIPGEDYRLIIKNSSGGIIDERNFSALKPKKENVRIALVSCMRDTRIEEQGGMWASLYNSDPDLLFMLGDNVYVDDGASKKDPVTPDKIWRRYVETRQALNYYKFPRLIPTLATWDDHDFGLNNTFGNTSWSESARDIFREMYAQDAVMSEVSTGPGISTSYSAYGHRFFLMDDRSFRGMKFIGLSHWGKQQDSWLFDQISLGSSPCWLFNGSQFFGGYRSGWSFEGNHGRTFKTMLSKLKNIKAPVVFGSGDVHYSEIMKIEETLMGYESFEITSSSMHSNAKPPVQGNKRRIQSTGEFNFVVADVKLIEDGLQMDVTSIGKEGAQLFSLANLKVTKKI